MPPHEPVDPKVEFDWASLNHKRGKLESAAGAFATNFVFAKAEFKLERAVFETDYHIKNGDLISNFQDSYNGFAAHEKKLYAEQFLMVSKFLNDPAFSQVVFTSADDPSVKTGVGKPRSYVQIYTRDIDDPRKVTCVSIEGPAGEKELSKMLASLGLKPRVIAYEGTRPIYETVGIRDEGRPLSNERIADAISRAFGESRDPTLREYAQRVDFYFSNREAILAAQQMSIAQLTAEVIRLTEQSGKGQLEALQDIINQKVRELNGTLGFGAQGEINRARESAFGGTLYGGTFQQGTINAAASSASFFSHPSETSTAWTGHQASNAPSVKPGARHHRSNQVTSLQMVSRARSDGLLHHRPSPGRGRIVSKATVAPFGARGFGMRQRVSRGGKTTEGRNSRLKGAQLDRKELVERNKRAGKLGLSKLEAPSAAKTTKLDRLGESRIRLLKGLTLKELEMVIKLAKSLGASEAPRPGRSRGRDASKEKEPLGKEKLRRDGDLAFAKLNNSNPTRLRTAKSSPQSPKVRSSPSGKERHVERSLRDISRRLSKLEQTGPGRFSRSASDVAPKRISIREKLALDSKSAVVRRIVKAEMLRTLKRVALEMSAKKTRKAEVLALSKKRVLLANLDVDLSQRRVR